MNIGNPDEFTLLELAETVIEVTGSQLGDRLRGAADGRPAGAPARHHAGARAARLGARGVAARGPAAHDRRRPGVEQLVGAAAVGPSLRAIAATSHRTSAVREPGACRRDGTTARHRTGPVVARRRDLRRCPSATCAASGRRRCRSCCAWRRCAASRASCRCWRSTSSASVAAIFTALMLKAARRDALGPGRRRARGTRTTSSFAYLITVLLFAGRGCTPTAPSARACRGSSPSLFQVTVVALVFALVNGEHFSSYYIFYGSLFFAVVYVGAAARCAYERADRAAAARGRLPAPRGARRHGRAHRGRRARAAPTARRADRGRRLRLARRRGPTTGCARSGTLEDMRRRARAQRVDEVIIADPDFPQQRGGRARRPVPPARRARAHRAVDDGDPHPPRRVRARPDGAAVRAQARRSSRASTSRSSAPSTSSASSLLLSLLSPLLLALALAVKLTSRGPVIYRSMRPGIGGAPFACFKFRTMYRDADERQADARGAQRGHRRAVQDPRRPAPDAGRARSCAASRSTSCRSSSTSCAARCRSSARGRCPSATSSGSRTGTRSATWCCPGITGLWQVSGRSELDFDDLVRLDFLYLERWSVFLDLTILLKTIPAVLSRRGAF